MKAGAILCPGLSPFTTIRKLDTMWMNHTKSPGMRGPSNHGERFLGEKIPTINQGEKMRSLQAAVVTACVVLLAGCDDTPSNSMTDAQNKKVAETEAWVPSIKVVDFVRENAWYDQGNKMRYIVRHNYNLQLTKPFGEVALDMVKDMEKGAKSSQQGGLAAAAQSMASGFFVAGMQAEANYQERFRAILKQCQECTNYLFKDEKAGKEVTTNRIIYFHLAWNWLSEHGFPEAETTTSTKSPRQAWTAFIKTEKGWMPASS